MAIGLDIYTRICVEILQPELDRIQEKYPNLFSVSENRSYPAYIMYSADIIIDDKDLLLIEDRLDRHHMESKISIANEFGMMNPKSWFMIAVNDKSFPEINTTEMANLMRQELGTDNIIVLFEGETLI
jgi:hypothetical protein